MPVDPLVGVLALVVLALAGARISFSPERIGSGPRLVLRTGTHFLFLGFALGPGGLGLLTTEATTQLFPFLALGLGWVGFHFGLQLRFEDLRIFPRRYHAVALGEALVTFALFFGGAWLVLGLAGVRTQVPVLFILGAAAAASVTTPAGIGMVSTGLLVRGTTRDLLFFAASLDAVVGIVVLAVSEALLPPPRIAAAVGPGGGFLLLGGGLGLGVVCGIVLLWLTRRRPTGEELVLFLMGICAFCAGAALQWGLSPLFAAVVAGALVANLGRDRQRIYAVLQRWEKPVYVAFLLVAGALLRLPSPWVFALAGGYVVLRAAAKTVAGAALVSAVPLDPPAPRRIGLGLIPQGGIALAMAVSGVLLYADVTAGPADPASVLFAVVVVGVVVSEITGPFLIVRVLRRAGEISPDVEEALARGDQRLAERAALRHDTNG